MQDNYEPRAALEKAGGDLLKVKGYLRFARTLLNCRNDPLRNNYADIYLKIAKEDRTLFFTHFSDTDTMLIDLAFVHNMHSVIRELFKNDVAGREVALRNLCAYGFNTNPMFTFKALRAIYGPTPSQRDLQLFAGTLLDSTSFVRDNGQRQLAQEIMGKEFLTRFVTYMAYMRWSFCNQQNPALRENSLFTQYAAMVSPTEFNRLKLYKKPEEQYNFAAYQWALFSRPENNLDRSMNFEVLHFWMYDVFWPHFYLYKWLLFKQNSPKGVKCARMEERSPLLNLPQELKKRILKLIIPAPTII
jgi:hypothetical protein